MPDTGSAPQRPIDAAMEANHRIGNQLATLLALAKKAAGKLATGPDVVRREDAVTVINGFAAKLAAVSTLHRTLAKTRRGDVQLACFLGDTLQPLKELYGDRLRLETRIDRGCTVTYDHAYVLALAFAEIVTNAMKYAHPTGLPVEMSVVGAATACGTITLEISDDGVGLPEGFDPQRGSGVGMKMIRSMVNAAGGELRTTSDALGLTLSMTLPEKRAGGGSLR